MRRPLVAAAALVVAVWGVETMATRQGPVGTSRWTVKSADLHTAALSVPRRDDQVMTLISPTGPRHIYHVLAGVPGGGNGSARYPFDSIGRAIDTAYPGDIVLVHRGTYRTPVTTARAGKSGAPIRLVSGGAQLVGNGQDRMVQILHSYISLERFSISNADKLVWVQGASHVRLLDNVLSHAGGECVRIKYLSQDNEVAGNHINSCGERNFDLAAHRKNGEGIYIGTAPEQLYKNPSSVVDQSNGNWVHDNVIYTRAECVDVKEGAQKNMVSKNLCVGSIDPDGAGFSSRGRETTFADNLSTRNAGAGIRLGGDALTDGILSVVQNNRLIGNHGYGLKVQRQPQTRICGNTVDRNDQGITNGTTNPSQSC